MRHVSRDTPNQIIEERRGQSAAEKMRPTLCRSLNNGAKKVYCILRVEDRLMLRLAFRKSLQVIGLYIYFLQWKRGSSRYIMHNVTTSIWGKECWCVSEIDMRIFGSHMAERD